MFDKAGALDKLEAFASLNGPAFYGLPVNEAMITLERQPWEQPEAVDLPGGDRLVSFRGGETLAWRLAG